MKWWPQSHLSRHIGTFCVCVWWECLGFTLSKFKVQYSIINYCHQEVHWASVQAWCTGKTQRNRVEREVGGRIGMGNTCNSMADSCQCMTKPTAMLWSNKPPTNKNKWKKKKRNFRLSFRGWLRSLLKCLWAMVAMSRRLFPTLGRPQPLTSQHAEEPTHTGREE